MVGDVATVFALRPQPELAVYSNEIRVTSPADSTPRKFFTVGDSVLEVSAVVHNFGFSASRPILVRITDAGPNHLTFTTDTVLPYLNDSVIVFAHFALS